MSYKFTVKNATLKFDAVNCHNKPILPAGTKHVDIAFQQSPYTWTDDNGNVIHLNVYRHAGKIYNAGRWN